MYTANGSISYGIHTPLSTFAQAGLSPTLNVVLPSSYGSSYTPYLFGTATVNGITYWNYYDPATGTLVNQIANASAARLIDGTVLAFGAQNGYVYRWNMTSVVNNNWPTGITWEVPLPTPDSSAAVQQIFAVSPDLSTIVVYNYNQYWAYNAATGASLWNLTLDYQVNTNEEIPLAQVADFIVWNPTASAWNCYSELTGALLWTTPSVASSPWATFWTVYWAETNDLNNVYFAAPDGIVRAYSLATGQLLWQSTPFPSTEYPNNVVPFATADMIMVGGNIYARAGYSQGYEINPVSRFSMMVCYNATTGNVEWTLNGGVAPIAAANGYLIGSSIFDGNNYCIGKGQTSTTVSVPQTAITAGTTVLISGTVLDQSPAQPNTPAISDANMSVWMDYLHMQNSTLLNAPPACIGVPVTLTAVDPNGNAINIGTVTSDTSGSFAYQWTPTTTGMYTIHATFTGSNSYYSSYAETHATVSTAPTVSPTPTPVSGLATTSDLLTYIVVAIVVIVIAIAIATVLMLRKRP
jgi:hypothetical protein